jgi:rhodanese-related sulfurtransferase
MSALDIVRGEPRPSAAERAEAAVVAGFGLDRLTARAAFQEFVTDGALLVDARPAAQRETYGGLAPWMSPLVAEYGVLERLLDPRSPERIAQASYDLRVIVVGQVGYSSALAAYSLRRIGIHRATDLDGGFEAWRAAGMPFIGPASI